MEAQGEASTTQLVERCRRRDETAFRELIRRFHHPVHYSGGLI
jgi:hypothetical protein